MIVIDANLLLYASNTDAPHHESAKAWLELVLKSGERVGIPWQSAWAFLRISTNKAAVQKPLSALEALDHIRRWISYPDVVLLSPGPRHLECLAQVVSEADVAGPKITDATIAALALEFGAKVATTDADFHHFHLISCFNPLKHRH